MKKLNHYTILADMFRYPYPEQALLTASWEEIIAAYGPELVLKFHRHVPYFRDKSLPIQQEYYINTFDVKALCYLDIGYVLFGEDYKRGVFLVNMKKEQESVENDCGSELPDHLPNILTLLPKLGERKLAEELVCSLMIPALHKMINDFQSNDNIYKELLMILVSIMETDFPDSEFEKFSFHIMSNNNNQGCFIRDNDLGSKT